MKFRASNRSYKNENTKSLASVFSEILVCENFQCLGTAIKVPGALKAMSRDCVLASDLVRAVIRTQYLQLLVHFTIKMMES